MLLSFRRLSVRSSACRPPPSISTHNRSMSLHRFRWSMRLSGQCLPRKAPQTALTAWSLKPLPLRSSSVRLEGRSRHSGDQVSAGMPGQSTMANERRPGGRGGTSVGLTASSAAGPTAPARPPSGAGTSKRLKQRWPSSLSSPAAEGSSTSAAAPAPTTSPSASQPPWRRSTSLRAAMPAASSGQAERLKAPGAKLPGSASSPRQSTQSPAAGSPARVSLQGPPSTAGAAAKALRNSAGEAQRVSVAGCNLGGGSKDAIGQRREDVQLPASTNLSQRA
mmetsp:Transcript_80230/g.253467  ORF Transcript_80230/g.253467 Transcript_80230/m.253467 type:complete len:278 (-) Transcript_80230:44-877(-)